MSNKEITDKTKTWVCDICGQVIATVFSPMDDKAVAAYDHLLATHKQHCKGEKK